MNSNQEESPSLDSSGLPVNGENRAEPDGEDSIENEGLHMDTCKLKHEQNGKETDSIQVSKLLKADSLEGRGGIATDDIPLRETAVFNSFEILNTESDAIRVVE